MEYELPVLSSRRGIIQGLLGLTAFFAVLFAVTGNAHFGDVVAVGLGATLLVAATPFLKLGNPLTRLVIVSPLYIPVFLAAILESSMTMMLMLAAVGLEIVVFSFLFLQDGKAELTARGLQRRRLLTTSFSFDEISGVKRFESRLGRLLRQVGFGSTSVEILLFSWRRVRLNVAPKDVEEFIARVSGEIDPTANYDLFFLPAPEATTDAGDAAEAKPVRRGRRPKQPADQEPEAPQIPSSAH